MVRNVGGAQYSKTSSIYTYSGLSVTQKCLKKPNTIQSGEGQLLSVIPTPGVGDSYEPITIPSMRTSIIGCLWQPCCWHVTWLVCFVELVPTGVVIPVAPVCHFLLMFFTKDRQKKKTLRGLETQNWLLAPISEAYKSDRTTIKEDNY